MEFDEQTNDFCRFPIKANKGYELAIVWLVEFEEFTNIYLRGTKSPNPKNKPKQKEFEKLLSTVY